MKRKLDGNEILQKIADLAFGKANDAVKLVLSEPDMKQLDELDLSMLSEVKRGSNGLIEIKLIDRLEAARLLAKLSGADGGDMSGADSFFKALNAAGNWGDA